MRIGLIGAGLMGFGIGANLLKAGHSLAVRAHRNRGPVEALIARGATEASSAEAIAEASEAVILCVSTSEVVENIVTRMAPHLAVGSLVIDCGTTRPETTRRLAAACADRAIGYADAPLTGGPEQAEAATLGALVGATPDVFARVAPLLSCFCSTVRHFGPPGSGHTAKLISNYLVTGMVALVADAFSAASRTGVAWAPLYDVMLNGSGNSGVLRKMVAPALEGDFGGYRFSVANAAKDIGYYRELGPGGALDEAVAEVFARALESGAPERPVSDLLNMRRHRPETAPMLTLNPAITAIEEESAFTVLDRANALKAKGHPVINLGIGQPDFSPPRHILAAAEKAVRDGPHGYSSPQGLPALREAVAAYVARRFNTPVDESEVVIVPGGKVTFYFACHLFGGPGAEILYPDPGFPPYRDAVRSSGAKPVAYPIREEKNFGFDAEEVLSLITPATRLLMINSPANPTGGVVDAAEMRKLAQGLSRHPHVAILSDEIYSHLLCDGVAFTSFLSFPELRERTIILDGWSKTFAMTGWRLGFGIWPKHLVEHVKKLITVDHSCTSVVTQMAGLAAITGPMDEIEGFRRSFERRRDLVVKGLNSLPGVTCRLPGGAFYAFPNVTGTGRDSGVLARELLDKAHVAIIAGESFGRNGKGYLRVSYAASDADIVESIRRMGVFLGG